MHRIGKFIGCCLIAVSLRLHKPMTVSYTHLRAHETDSYLVCRLLLEKKKKNIHTQPLKHLLHTIQIHKKYNAVSWS